MVWACALMECEKMGFLLVSANMSVGEERLSVPVASSKMGCFEGLRVVVSTGAGRSRRRERMFSCASVRGRVEGMV